MTSNEAAAFPSSKLSPSALRNLGASATTLVALFILSALFWYTEILGPAKVEVLLDFNIDVFSYFYPPYHWAAQSLRAGMIPLWNPYQSCGKPFLATYQVAVFYPPHILYLMLPTHLAMGFLSIFHVFLAGALMYLYCRSMGMLSAASCLSGLTFMLSVVITIMVWWPNQLACVVWLPLAFLCCDKVIDTKQSRWTIALGSVVALQVLSGQPQFMTYCFYALSLYGLVRTGWVLVCEGEARVLLRVGAGFALAAAVAASLSAVQWLPTLELSGLSTRPPRALSLEQVEVVGPLTTFSPATFLEALSDPSPGGMGSEPYIGLVPLVSVFFFPFSKRRARGLFFLLLAVGGVMLSFGTNFPAFKLFYRLPTGSWFRLPARIIFLYTFALSILAGMGFDALTGMARRVQRTPRLMGFGAVCLLAAVALLMMPSYGTIYAGLFLILVSLLFIVRGRFSGDLLWHILLVLLLVLVSLDLFIKHSRGVAHPQATPHFFNKHEPAMSFLRRNQGFHRTYVGFPGPVPQTFGTLKGIFMIADYEAFSLRRYQEFLEFFGAATLLGPDAWIFNGGFVLQSTPRNLKALRLLGAKYVMIPRRGSSFFQRPKAMGEQKQPNLRDEFHPVYYDRDVVIYEMANVLPRAYLVENFEVIREKRDILEELAEESFDPRRCVIIEEDPSEPTEGRNDSASEHKVIITDYRPNQVTISVDAPRGGLLVLMDTFFPGWKVFVNGREGHIHRANYLFRAIRLRAGHSEVHFQYVPLSFRVGAWTSGVGLLMIGICVIGILYQWNVGRRRRLAIASEKNEKKA